MAQILSQEEVDALLQGLDKGEEPHSQDAAAEVAKAQPARDSKARHHPDDVQTYDFSRSTISIHARLPGLEVIFSRFTRRLRNLFVTELGQTVDTAFDAMEVVLDIEAAYEIFEWIIAILMAPDWADSFNGQQGDPWDAQADMLLALCGATTAAVLLICWQNRQPTASQ